MASDNTPKRTPAMEIKELKATIKDLHAQAEKDRAFIKELQEESNNLELALKKCINSKAELNDKIEQLQDDANKYMKMYLKTKKVAQCLAEAVGYLTQEKQHG